MAKKKQKYTAAEKRAYWIGVGRSFESGDAASRLSANDFANNLSEKEDRSYPNGIMATAYNPDMFKRKRKK